MLPAAAHTKIKTGHSDPYHVTVISTNKIPCTGAPRERGAVWGMGPARRRRRQNPHASGVGAWTFNCPLMDLSVPFWGIAFSSWT